MGWGLKIGLFLLAVIAATFGAWIITVPILGVLFLPAILAKKKGGRKSVEDSGPTRKNHRWPLTKVAGALLVLSSVAAFFSGGHLSPIVLAVAGFALLFSLRLSPGISARAKPVADSILLRGALLPFRWNSIAEVKVSTRDIEGALSGVSDRLLFVSNPTPRIFLVFSTNSLSRTKAEEEIIRHMQSVARALGPLGAYLLPLDSANAASASKISAARIEPQTENLNQLLASADYGALAAEAQDGFVKGFELYARTDVEQKSSSILSDLDGRPSGHLTLREVLREARARIGTPQPDRYVAFLSSMAATEGETLGQRIAETAQGPQEQVLLVSSPSSPRVELSRAQLSAVVKIY